MKSNSEQALWFNAVREAFHEGSDPSATENPSMAERQMKTPDLAGNRRVYASLKRSIGWRVVKDEEGATLVESAITWTTLILLIFGMMDCSRALYFDHYVRYSAEEAARYAMVRGSTWNSKACISPATEGCTASSNDVVNLVKSITPIGTDSSLNVGTTWTGLTPVGTDCSASNVNNSPGCVVQVKVTYSFNFVFPFLPKNALLLSSTSAVAIAQ